MRSVGASAQRRIGLLQLLRETWERFDQHGDLLAAAISFYTLISVAPLIVIAVSVAGLVFDPVRVRAALLHGLRGTMSSDITQLLSHVLDASELHSSKLAAVLAGVMLFWAASRLFLQIQAALNLIWGVEVTTPSGMRATLLRVAIKRLVSFAMVIGCGALLLATLVLHTILSALGSALQRIQILSGLSAPLLVGQELLLSFVLLSLLFAMIYRLLPDVRIQLRDVWLGAVLTAVLVLAGTWLLGLYLSRIAPSWLQGAVGSLAAFMLWTYYLAQVFLVGAAFTRVWSGRGGSSVKPEEYAQFSHASDA